MSQTIVFGGAQGTKLNQPAVGNEVARFSSTDNRLVRQGNDQFDFPIDNYLQNSLLAVSAGIANTDTYIIASSANPAPVYCSANDLTVGTRLRFKLRGSCNITSATGGSQIFTMRYGTNKGTADTSFGTITVVATNNTGIFPFEICIEVTITTIGASGIVYGYATAIQAGTTGFNNVTYSQIPVSVSGPLNIGTNSAGYIGLSYKSGAATVTTTFNDMQIEVCKY